MTVNKIIEKLSMTEEFDLFTSERLLSTHSSLMDFIMTCKKKNKEKNLHLLQCHKNCPLLIYFNRNLDLS